MIQDGPKFRRPPVVETVLGAQFEPLVTMRVVHFGLYWQVLKEDFPTIEERASLPPENETFEVPLLRPPLPWRLSARLLERPPLPRAWFIGGETGSGQQLIQMQFDRFLYNWRRKSLESQEYPSYDANRAEFWRRWSEFVEFARNHELGDVVVNQCEVTYANQIRVPDGCGVGEMAARCFPSLSGKPSDEFLPSAPERTSFDLAYQMTGQTGRLHISCSPAVEEQTGCRFLDLRLTARGAPQGADIAAVMNWLDLGHEWVVKGFRSITSKAMHNEWGVQK